MSRSLYICYFWLREPLVQTQVLPYLRELVKGGHEITLLTFENAAAAPWAPGDIIAATQELAAEGIDWRRLSYHKRPSVPATMFDIANGARAVRDIIKKKEIDILHCRVHVPAVMGALGRSMSMRKPKLLFDIRGFFPEEYTDAGVWPAGGLLYQSAKSVERWLLKESDGFVVLTQKAREILFPGSKGTDLDERGRPVEVIPCCVDMSRFRHNTSEDRTAARARLGLDRRRAIAYVGSFGGWYMTEEMLDLFGAAREADKTTYAMILTQRDHEPIKDGLRRRGFDDADMLVTRAAPADLQQYLVAADVAISLIKPCYSKLSSSPTKIAEYLAAGVPIIANRGVGDVDELIDANGVGALLDGFDKPSYRKALSHVEHLGDIREKCIATAVREFDLGAVAGERYRRLYERLVERE